MKTTADMLTLAVAAETLGISQRSLQLRCASGSVPKAVKRDGVWRIPVDYDVRLSGVSLPEHKGLDKLDEVPAEKRQEAQNKAAILTEAEQFAAAAVAAGQNRCDAIGAFCSQRQVPRRTLYRWRMRWKQEGLLGLVDSRGAGKFRTEMISPDAWSMFMSSWLDLRQPSVKICWQNLKFHNQQHNLGWQIPELRTMYDLIDRLIPRPLAVLHRQGQAAYDAQCAPYIVIDPESIAPNQVWVGDHHQLNCMIRHKGQWARPWITAWEDRRSRTIVGWILSDSPNQTTIMLAFRNGCRTYGPPDSVKIDNGRDYDSEMWTGTTKQRRRVLGKGYLDEGNLAGIYAMMNISVSFAIPYHPQSKPIERWFDTLDCQFTKTLATYCGKDTARKPEDLIEFLKTQESIDKAHTLDSLSAMLERYIDAYNGSAHTGLGMDGRSPNEVMSTRTSRRVLLDGVLDLLCRVWTGEQTVGKNGVTVKGLPYGQFSPELHLYQGRKVRCAYDPQDLSCVHVYDAATYKLVAIADQVKMIAHGVTADETALREASAKKARARKMVRQMRDATRTANMDLTSLTIEAMRAAARPSPEPDDAAMRPSATALDGQVAISRAKTAARAVRRAAGAEQITHVRDLDIDFESLRPQRTTEDLDIDFALMRKPKPETLDLDL